MKLPHFDNISVVTKGTAQGELGLRKSIELLVPNGFKLTELDHQKLEALFINKGFLAKIAEEGILGILENKVFDFMTKGELIKVGFKGSVSHNPIEY